MTRGMLYPIGATFAWPHGPVWARGDVLRVDGHVGGEVPVFGGTVGVEAYEVRGARWAARALPEFVPATVGEQEWTRVVHLCALDAAQNLAMVEFHSVMGEPLPIRILGHRIWWVQRPDGGSDWYGEEHLAGAVPRRVATAWELVDCLRLADGSGPCPVPMGIINYAGRK